MAVNGLGFIGSVMGGVSEGSVMLGQYRSPEIGSWPLGSVHPFEPMRATIRHHLGRVVCRIHPDVKVLGLQDERRSGVIVGQHPGRLSGDDGEAGHIAGVGRGHLVPEAREPDEAAVGAPEGMLRLVALLAGPLEPGLSGD